MQETNIIQNKRQVWFEMLSDKHSSDKDDSKTNHQRKAILNPIYYANHGNQVKVYRENYAKWLCF